MYPRRSSYLIFYAVRRFAPCFRLPPLASCLTQQSLATYLIQPILLVMPMDFGDLVNARVVPRAFCKLDSSTNSLSCQIWLPPQLALSRDHRRRPCCPPASSSWSSAPSPFSGACYCIRSSSRSPRSTNQAPCGPPPVSPRSFSLCGCAARVLDNYASLRRAVSRSDSVAGIVPLPILAIFSTYFLQGFRRLHCVRVHCRSCFVLSCSFFCALSCQAFV